MGWKSIISMRLTNSIMVIFQKLKGENSKDLKDAMKYLKHHNKKWNFLLWQLEKFLKISLYLGRKKC